MHTESKTLIEDEGLHCVHDWFNHEWYVRQLGQSRDVSK